MTGPSWWACWIPFAPALICRHIADRLDRRARATGGLVDHERAVRQIREAIRRSNGGAR